MHTIPSMMFFYGCCPVDRHTQLLCPTTMPIVGVPYSNAMHRETSSAGQPTCVQLRRTTWPKLARASLGSLGERPQRRNCVTCTNAIGFLRYCSGYLRWKPRESMLFGHENLTDYRRLPTAHVRESPLINDTRLSAYLLSSHLDSS